MAEGFDTTDNADRWRLEPSDIRALRALQVCIMHAELQADRREKSAAHRTEQLAGFVASVDAEETGNDQRPTAPATAQAPGWEENLDRIIAAAPSLAAKITERAPAVVVLAELMVSDPWTDGIGRIPKAHRAATTEVAELLPGLRPGDCAAIWRELDVVSKQLHRKSIRWDRVAAATAVGLAAGVVTGGMAAPAVGAAIGSTLLGFSGAAASSAGLAALGGGSLAVGGFGMFGGTVLVSSVGGLAGAGVAGIGTRYSGLASTTIAAEAVKLGLIARILLEDEQDRDQKMRRVVESLHQAQNDLARKVTALSERIAELKKNNRELDENNKILHTVVGRLRAELVDARAELKALRAELADTEKAATTIEVVLDRLPEPDADAEPDPDSDLELAR
ncbi:hypothetical protein [Nocardia noduli]|uniref:hypothetical protein n=1 Tax=Nocardia noduli TaxID=2815722 RepID=UPI001C237E52|nr:hypothetical protein [Nocardia noduli]